MARGGAENDADKAAQEIGERSEEQVAKEKDRMKDELDDHIDRMESQLLEFRRDARDQIDRANRTDWNRVSQRLRDMLNSLDQAASRAASMTP